MSNLFKRYITIIQEKTNVDFASFKKIKEKQELNINNSILNQSEINEFETALKDDNKKIVIILVGLPATGKTTLTKSIKTIFNQNDVLLIDRDEILNDTAREFGLNFDDLFYIPRDTHEQLDHPKFGKWSRDIPSPFGGWEKIYKANSTATAKLNKTIFNSVNTDKKVILIDSLYINVFQRKKIISLFKNQKEKFYTIAIVTNPNLNQKNENIIKNKKLVSYRTLKTLRENNPIIVTPSIIDTAANNFEYPSKKEGFNLILNIDNIDRIFTKLLKRKINIDKIISDSPLEKSFRNFKIRKFIDLIDKTNFDKKLNFNSGFRDHFSNQINIDSQNEENKKIIKKVQEMYPEIIDILIDNGYPKYKPIDTFLKELDAFYDYKFKNIIYFYENYINE